MSGTGAAHQTRPLTSMDRRRFGAVALGATGAVLAAPALAQAKPRLVVVGGGPGGAGVARYAAKEAPGLQVSLVVAGATLTTSSFSNLYLAGYRSLRSLTHRYDLLASRYAVRPVVDRAVAVDRRARQLRLAGGATLPYDRLVLAPGVSLQTDAIEGYDARAQEIMPHAYASGYQSYLLRRRLQSMRQGGVFVVAPPIAPYRCPPAPYERASMAALYFSRFNPTAKILILDGKDSFPMQRLFEEGWAKHFPGMIEWRPASLTGGGVVRVDPAASTVITGAGESIPADLANIIPPQQAGQLVLDAGLADREGWAPVDPETFRSRLDDAIFVLGDAARAGEMPKSAFSANSQAHQVAATVQADLAETQLFPPRYRSTLWSFISRQDVVKIGASYRVEEGQIRARSSFVSETGEAREVRLDNALEANAWYAAMTADVFA